MSIEDNIAESIPTWRTWVEENGGNYVGVQKPIFCDGGFGFEDEPRVMFTRVNSTTLLSLPVSLVTSDSIKQKLGNKTILNVVKKQHLIGLLEKLHGVADQIMVLSDEVEDLALQIEEELRNAEK